MRYGELLVGSRVFIHGVAHELEEGDPAIPYLVELS